MYRARLRPGLRGRVASSSTAAPSSGEETETATPAGSPSASSAEVVETTPTPSRSIG